MSPEAQQIAIAEWCGCKLTQIADGTKFSNPEEPLMVQRWVNEKLNRVDRKLPDYLNDLNAIHEAEEKLTDGEYNHHFIHYLDDTQARTLEHRNRCVSATAAQRAEALLRAIGRWTE